MPITTNAADPRDRLIFALDVPDATDARRVVEQLGDSITFYKLGLELMAAGGYFELVDWLLGKNKRVFADLKLFDVPATVAAACSGDWTRSRTARICDRVRPLTRTDSI